MKDRSEPEPPLSGLQRRLKSIALWIAVFAVVGAVASAVVHLYTKSDHADEIHSDLADLTNVHFAQLGLIGAHLGVRADPADVAMWYELQATRSKGLEALAALEGNLIERFRHAELYYESLAEQAWSAINDSAPGQAELSEHEMERQGLTDLLDAKAAITGAVQKEANEADRWADRGTIGLLFSLTFAALLLHSGIRRTKKQGALAQQKVVERKDQWLHSLLDDSSDMINVTDAEGRIIYASPSVERLLGWPEDEVRGMSAWDLMHPDDIDHVQDSLVLLVQGSDDYKGDEFRVRAKDGTWHWVEAVGRLVVTDETVQVVINYRLIDERLEYERQLTERAFHDPLTNLANRALLLNRIEVALTQRREGNERPLLALLDLDDFKTLNDGLGHAAGDELLQAVAKRLRAAFRAEDTVARLGGDEFVILSERSSEDPFDMGQRIVDVLEGLFDVADHSIHVYASIGIAAGIPDLSRPEDLLRAADVAMYRAKKDGKSCYRVFTQDLRIEAVRRGELATEIEEGLAAGEFWVAYQPIIRFQDGAICGAEALVRWKHPKKGGIAASEFIQIAEESGAIIPLGTFVLRAACEWFSAAMPLLEPDFKLHVNASVKQLYDAEFPSLVASVAAEYGIQAGRLVLEITETTLIENLSAVQSCLHALDALGIGIAIDDFGTGYSSLAHLHQFPIDVLKIDSSFVSGMRPGPHGGPITAAVVNLGRAFGYEVVAEGIERLWQIRRLMELGCEQGQGYLFGRPMEGTKFLEFLYDKETLGAESA